MRPRPVLFLAFAAVVTSLSAADKPNILFIFSDDHALNSISAYGSRLKDIAPTPNIDRIAKGGAVLTRSYCCNSICGPSRAAVLTGKHSVHNGFIDNEKCTFDGNQQTFPKLLQQAGYQTAVIGKWHLVSEPTGFDYFEIFPATSQGWYYNPEFVTKEGKHQETGYATDLITDKTLSWLEKRDKTKPFMLMCQHKAVHRNWSPAARHLNDFKDVTIPEPETLFDDYANRSETLKQQQMSVAKNFSWQSDMKLPGENEFPQFFTSEMQNLEYKRMNEEQRKVWDAAYTPENNKILADLRVGNLSEKDVIRWKYQRYMKDYLRTVKAMDEGVGKVLDYLDSSGLAKNTIVIYCSDQGFYLGEHGWYDKRWMFEESLQMPFLIRWPGVIKPGTHNPSIIQNIDYAPTFLDIAGAPIPDDIQGTSLVPVLKAGEKTPDKWRDSIYYFYSGERTHAVAAHEGVRTDRYKLMWFPKTKEWNLFDLEKDPQETRSVANDPAYAQTLEEMKKKLDELKKQYKIPAA